MKHTEALISNDLTPEKYLEFRVQEMINHLREQSRINRRRYFMLKIVQIILSVATASCLISALIVNEFQRYYISIALLISIGTITTELTTSVFRFYEFWIKYRDNARSLERETMLFKAKAGPYQFDNPTVFNDFVLRMEQMISE